MILDFAICTDENFVIPALVCITSILENNRDDKCRIYVLTEGISEKSKEKFEKLASIYQQEINIITLDSSPLEAMITRDRYPVSMYFRLMLPYVLKRTDRVLYLDCDTMVRHSLRELFFDDLSEKACGVVIDQQCDDTQIHNRLRIESDYFNSGVMMMNLKLWREKKYTERVIKYIEENPEKCVYPDQDALNVVLAGKVRYLDLKYNVQEMWLTMLDYARFHYGRYPELERALMNPSVIHFCVGDKPWFTECRNPYREEFLMYAGMYAFIGFKERSHYSKLYIRIEKEILRLKRWQKRFIKN